MRPPELLRARNDHAEGKIAAAELRAAEDEAIRGVVELQRDVGLRSVTDGEFRRGSWHMDFIYALGGVDQVPGHLTSTFTNPDGTIEFTPPAIRVTRKVTVDETIFGDDFAFTQSVAPDGMTPKLTIPAPSMVHYRSGLSAVADDSVYPDPEEFWTDVAAAYGEQVRRIGAQGCRYLQFDDTSLAYLNDPAQREYIRARGEDADRMHLRYIALTNAAVKNRPDGMTVTTHLCRGNYRSSWVASGGYDYVAEALFSELDVDGFFLEFDDERSGGFEPLRFVPKDKKVVLGLVTTKRPGLESKDDLKRRIDEAARYVGIDQLCLSGQCGFSSTVEGNALTVDDEIAKLRLITETAAEVWG
ncbi:MAG: 5-methyltetrahydropteroyltriglutamate--homocysteine S-methyltransferase [Streptosporangiales bacterium]|nr:5-methyltetrahydropteroyltriglutamate--homocysteine S-methyltransferase [Streptosporangiales bacterium]